MKEKRKKFDIYDRAFTFAVNCAKLIKGLPKEIILIEYMRQLVRSSGSIGANLEEADGALTKRDFVYKVAISRREAKESRHWLKLIKVISENKSFEKEIDALIKESTEILLILSKIINNTKNN
ncbi:MAG: four helix bundle protein [Candidatus Zapsychrus exili]|nr:four helix bundle protein [Candidatus Zapsychrus exili]